jgi:hypothetical protein
MRLKRINQSSAEYKELESFNDWMLSIGNGTIKETSDTDNASDSMLIEIPEELLVQTTGDKIKALVESTYPDFQENFQRLIILTCLKYFTNCSPPVYSKPALTYSLQFSLHYIK